MIIQEIGVPYLLILAREILEKNLFAEGNYFEGDLLNSVLKIKPVNWANNKEHWHQIDKLIKNRLDDLKNYKPKLDIENFYSVKFE